MYWIVGCDVGELESVGRGDSVVPEAAGAAAEIPTRMDELRHLARESVTVRGRGEGVCEGLAFVARGEAYLGLFARGAVVYGALRLGAVVGQGGLVV